MSTAIDGLTTQESSEWLPFRYANTGDFLIRPLFPRLPELLTIPEIAGRYQALIQAASGYTDAELDALALHFASSPRGDAAARKAIEERILSEATAFDSPGRRASGDASPGA